MSRPVRPEDLHLPPTQPIDITQWLHDVAEPGPAYSDLLATQSTGENENTAH